MLTSVEMNKIEVAKMKRTVILNLGGGVLFEFDELGHSFA
jgi:hypothetical protein